jgi:uncharacterized protein YyaL (SSP411 family)
VAATVPQIAARTSRSPEQTAALLDSAQEKLRAARARRPAPFVDRTLYTNWNAMMVSALLQAAAVLRDPWAREHGLRTLHRIRAASAEPDAVAHTAGGVTGLLDDQAQAAAAALDAHEATGEEDWLQWSQRLMDRVWTDHEDREHGGLFDEVIQGEGAGFLPLPAKTMQDMPSPSPNAVAAIVGTRLYHHTGEARWHERAATIIKAFAGGAAEIGLFGSTYLTAIDWHLNPATHLVIVGDAGDELAEWMHREALACLVPRRIVHRVSPARLGHRALPAAVTAMVTHRSRATGYACVGTTCAAPAESEEAWVATLGQLLQPRPT